MRLLTRRLPFAEGDSYTLYFFGDQHRHHRNAAKGHMKRDIEEIANDPNGLVFLMGDSHECISKNDPRYDEGSVDWSLIEPGYSMKFLADTIVDDRTEFFRPIAEKIVVDLAGNHDGRYAKYAETDIRLRSLDRLGRSDAYVHGMGGALVRLVFEDEHRHMCSYVINAAHGKRTSKHKATLLNSYGEKLCHHWDNVDLLVRGHCHHRGYDDILKLCTNANHTKLKEKNVGVALSGGYLQTYREDGEAYSEDLDLDPTDIGMQRIIVHPSRSGVHVEGCVR